jgi:hypothetical protein
MTEKVKNQLYMQVRQHNSSMRFPCVLCGEYHMQDLANAELKISGDDEELGDVCPECLDAEPAGAAERTREYVQYLREKADALEALAKEVEMMPTDDWATRSEVEAASKANYADQGYFDDDLFDSEETKMTYESCNAKIKINGWTCQCSCEPDHDNPLHVCQGIKLSNIVYDGFEWGIDDEGVVILKMSSAVAQKVFYDTEEKQELWEHPVARIDVNWDDCDFEPGEDDIHF